MGGSELDEETWKNILLECDMNGDGKVNIIYKIFLNYLFFLT